MDIYYFMILFTACSSIIAWTSWDDKIKKIVYLGLNFLPMGVLCGLRAEQVGTDTTMYFNMIEDVFQTSLVDYVTYTGWEKHFDLGWVLLINLVQWVSSDVQSVIFIAAIISIGGFAIAIYKYSDNVYMSTLLFITLGYWFQHFNLMRQFMGMMIMLFAFEALVNSQKAKFIGLTLLASQFHASMYFFLAFAIFLLFPITSHNIKRWFILSLLCVFTAGIFPTEKIISQLPVGFSWYLASDFAAPRTQGVVLVLVKCAIIISIVYLGIRLSDRFSDLDRKKVYYFAVSIMWACVFSTMQFQFGIFYRLVDIFQYFLIFYIPIIYQYMKTENGYFSRYIFSVILFALCIGYYSYLINNAKDMYYYIGL